ncbi:hypothetical protein FHR90_002397 [Endobacter medicaginis]|uniref:Uncharacterized protein n=1 Tax=Endobacter medicaginis TaxID=1181271 RepID=A0A839V4T9_9PROT|nr:hypothetical protein [Endobacter medicaginis]MBB3174552.1 hypothetical protein [Endobacter medicaginis]MCX5474755.1 hypothetical protein [Endobacter medicaginis]NVN29177.1 hypothetical protein [Endobacter medicaginis]
MTERERNGGDDVPAEPLVAGGDQAADETLEAELERALRENEAAFRELARR